ncbi:hypothetical protein M9458_019370, partial [Cirrhinus mrigala]
LHGEGWVYDLYWDPPPGGKRNAPLFKNYMAHLVPTGSTYACLVFSDPTMKTMEQRRMWRQKRPRGTSLAARPEKAEGGNLTLSPVFSDTLEKAEYPPMELQRKWRQKKPQIASVPCGSPQGAPVSAGDSQFSEATLKTIKQWRQP